MSTHVIAIIVGIVINVIGDILIYHYTNPNTMPTERKIIFYALCLFISGGIAYLGYKYYVAPKKQYYAYFADITKDFNYISAEGDIKLPDKERGFFDTKTNAKDLLDKKERKYHSNWEMKGYLSDKHLNFSYGAGGGVAYFKLIGKDYIGYWIGASQGIIVKCPYVLSPTKISIDKYDDIDEKKDKLIKEWDIFKKDCCEYNIAQDTCNDISFPIPD